MYRLKPGIKRDPVRRWNLPDRIFFGHGACHILAGVFLDSAPMNNFHAEWIRPRGDFAGSHIYVTDGSIAFDYHGYSVLSRLLKHHETGWSEQYPGWNADRVWVDFPLLDTAELNQRKMLGPNQYHADPIARAGRFIRRIDHAAASKKALALAS